jgi:hypothetical protein
LKTKIFLKINLHPFIYYKNGWRQTWQEFDLPIPSIILYNEKITKPEVIEAPKVKSKKKKKNTKAQ